MEQSSVISFLWAKRLRANAIHSDMRPMYGDKCFTIPSCLVYEICHGRESVAEEERVGRSHHRYLHQTFMNEFKRYGDVLMFKQAC